MGGGERRGIEEERVWVKTDKDANFTDALVQNAKEDEILDKDIDEQPFEYAEFEVCQVTIVSDQQLHYELYFWSSDDFDDTDLDVDSFLGSVDLDLPVSGKQVDGAGPYRLDVEISPRVNIIDLTDSKKIYVSLVNRSATAKNTGATGEVVVTLALAPRR